MDIGRAKAIEGLARRMASLRDDIVVVLILNCGVEVVEDYRPRLELVFVEIWGSRGSPASSLVHVIGIQIHILFSICAIVIVSFSEEIS